MKEENEILKQRAEKFYNYAIKAFENNDFEIAAFNLEQSAQLYLKYTLSILLGDFPKTHQLRKLIDDIIKVTQNKELKELLEKSHNIIADLEAAYITSRYLPASFYKKQVENIIDFVNQLKSSLEKLWS